jgi:uncharacterized protein with ATP-grasp and redox domains
MKMQLDCLPCFLRQALEASRMGTGDLRVQTEILKEALTVIGRFDAYRYAPEVGREVHAIVKRLTGVADPYRQIKQNNLKLAESYYSELKRFLFAKGGGLEWVLKIAAIGNNLDAAIYQEVTDVQLFERELEKEFAICDLKRWEQRLKTAKKLLIIGDNAGETVFDRIFIEQLLYLEVTYAVRSAPIINDVTVADAVAARLDRHARVITSGCDAPGLILQEGAPEFVQAYQQADLVLSKGQGNYETLSETAGREVFFLLKAKCPVIAADLGVDVGSYIFKAGGDD